MGGPDADPIEGGGVTTRVHTAVDLRERRAELEAALRENRVHIVRVLKDPEWWLESAEIGDVLCWCVGLDDAAVSRILRVLGINWGRRVALLRERDKARIFYRVKTRRPEVWKLWKESIG